MSFRAAAAWLGVWGSALQLLGSVMTLWGLLSAAKTWLQRARALVGALWRSPKSRVAAGLSDLNAEDRSRVQIDSHGRIWITEAGFFAPPSKVAVLNP